MKLPDKIRVELSLRGGTPKLIKITENGMKKIEFSEEIGEVFSVGAKEVWIKNRDFEAIYKLKIDYSRLVDNDSRRIIDYERIEV